MALSQTMPKHGLGHSVRVPNRAWGLSTVRDTRMPCPKPCLGMVWDTRRVSQTVPGENLHSETRGGLSRTVPERTQFWTPLPGTVLDSQAVSRSVPAQARNGTGTVRDTTDTHLCKTLQQGASPLCEKGKLEGGIRELRRVVAKLDGVLQGQQRERIWRELSELPFGRMCVYDSLNAVARMYLPYLNTSHADAQDAANPGGPPGE
ncbi:hypothetical protein Bbelb_110240 [Branchiostoma belcheri]|nr:hypothetical protein Bbelb_110240 [Branchiostoma belcheri]